MKKVVYILSSLFCLSLSQSIAQDTLVVMKAGQVVYKRAVNEVDSIIFKSKTTISTSSTVTDISGNVYPTVTIGTQTWMGENLRVEKYNNGTPIPLVTDALDWSNNYTNKTKLPMMAWYDNDKVTHSSNKNGALYNWFVVDTKKLCPIGWHVPTDAEWSILTDYLGEKAGLRMKSTAGWNLVNSTGYNGTNDVNFNALPAGYRELSSGIFDSFGYYGYWWSSSASTDYAWIRVIGSNSYYGNVGRSSLNQGIGYSVRCLKD